MYLSVIPGSRSCAPRNDKGKAMAGFWGKNKDRQDAAVSADFQRELTREVMRTELIRVKALIATISLLAIILWSVYLLAPETVSRIWHGTLRPA